MDDIRRSNNSMIVGGILFIVLGILCIIFRNVALATLTIIAGICFAAAGIGGIINYRQYNVTDAYAGWMMVGAILNLVLGIVFILYPFVFLAVLPWLIGLLVLVVGIFEVINAVRSRKMASSAWGYDLLVGVLTIVFGLLMCAFPGLLAVLIGIFMIMRGIIMLGGGLAFGKMFA